MYASQVDYLGTAIQIQKIRKCEGCLEENHSFQSSTVFTYENRFSLLYEQLLNALKVFTYFYKVPESNLEPRDSCSV